MHASTTTTDLALHGRTIAAHVRAADRHGHAVTALQAKKESHHLLAAGLLLREAKAEIPRGKFDPFLREHGIARSTAYRLMREAANPQAAERRRAQQRERARKAREAAEDARRRADTGRKVRAESQLRELLASMPAEFTEEVLAFAREQAQQQQ